MALKLAFLIIITILDCSAAFSKTRMNKGFQRPVLLCSWKLYD